MSEILENTETVPETGTGTQQENTDPTPPASTSRINLAVEAVMDMIDALGNFALVTRGALGTDNGISCEIAPSMVDSVFMDKNIYIPVTLALNAKHTDLQILSDTLNNIMDSLTRYKSYTSGNGWEIVDITNGNLPRVIGREDNNKWLMACDLIVKIYRKDDEPNESELGE